MQTLVEECSGRFYDPLTVEPLACEAVLVSGSVACAVLLASLHVPLAVELLAAVVVC